jgi:hypothetical protein
VEEVTESIKIAGGVRLHGALVVAEIDEEGKIAVALSIRYSMVYEENRW